MFAPMERYMLHAAEVHAKRCVAANTDLTGEESDARNKELSSKAHASSQFVVCLGSRWNACVSELRLAAVDASRPVRRM